MSDIFVSILQMSISASVIALIVIIARYFLRNSPKKYSYVLWAAVLLRLICPFSLTLEIPVETQTEPHALPEQSEQVNTPDILVSEDPIYSAAPEFPSDTVTDSEHTNTPVTTIPNTENPVKTAVKPINALTAVWLIGVAAMLGYMAWSYISLYSHVKSSTRMRGTVFQSDRINTAFVLGVITPKVYMPSYLSFDDAKGVILHEQTHIRRGDHIVKIIAFAALAVHWFNPFIWLSYWLMSLDMEHSCDEAVIEGLCDRGYKLSGVKRGYGQMLISLAIRDVKMPSVAFSENDVKGRLSHILNYKGADSKTRKTLWTACVAMMIVCVLLPVIKGTEVDAVDSGAMMDATAIEPDYSNSEPNNISDFSGQSESIDESVPHTEYLPVLFHSSISCPADFLLIPEEDLETHIIQIDCELFFSESKSKRQAYNLTGETQYAPPYAEFETLKNTPKLKHLELYNVAALDASELTDLLTGMPNLQTLIISGGYIESESYVLDLCGLSQLQALKYLQILSIPISEDNLVDIASLSNLEELDLNAYPYSAAGSADLSPLSRLKKLKKLTLFLSSTRHDNIVIDDISAIGELDNLVSLAIGVNRITDFSPIGKLANLSELVISLDQDADCSFIRSLTVLTRLDVSNHGQRNESFIASVTNLSNLKELSLTGSSFSNIEWLENVQSLEKLYLTNTGTHDISVISRLKNLKSARLSNFEYSGVDFEALKSQVNAFNESTDDCVIILDEGKG